MISKPPKKRCYFGYLTKDRCRRLARYRIYCNCGCNILVFKACEMHKNQVEGKIKRIRI